MQLNVTELNLITLQVLSPAHLVKQASDVFVSGVEELQPATAVMLAKPPSQIEVGE